MPMKSLEMLFSSGPATVVIILTIIIITILVVPGQRPSEHGVVGKQGRSRSVSHVTSSRSLSLPSPSQWEARTGSIVGRNSGVALRRRLRMKCALRCCGERRSGAARRGGAMMRLRSRADESLRLELEVQTGFSGHCFFPPLMIACRDVPVAPPPTLHPPPALFHVSIKALSIHLARALSAKRVFLPAPGAKRW